MIFQKFLKRKSLTSRLYRSFAAKVLLAAAFMLVLPGLSAVKLIFDIQPAGNAVKIGQLNFSQLVPGSSVNQQSQANPELSPSQQTTVSAITGADTSPLSNPMGELLDRLSHTFTNPAFFLTTSSRPNANACEVFAMSAGE